jgi:hypothetical protein
MVFVSVTSNTTRAIGGARTAYTYGARDIAPIINGVCVAQFVVF